MNFFKNYARNTDETIKYVTAAAIIETVFKCLDFFAPLFIPASELPPGVLLGTILGVGIRIPAIWYLYHRKSRSAAVVLLGILLLSVLAGAANIFSSIFLFAACLGVYETFRSHAAGVAKSAAKAPRASLFRRYLFRPMALVWAGYVLLCLFSIGLYALTLLARPTAPDFTDAEIHAVQQSLVHMQSGEWNTQQAIDNMTPEMREKIRAMGITEEEFLRKMILGILSDAWGVDLR